MGTFWQVLYNGIGLPLLHSVLMLASLFQPKIKQGMKGRKDLFEKLELAVARLPKLGPRFWIHNSSMGEFEQAKPLIERLKRKFPKGSVVVSFFSPSGFDHVQDYQGADLLCYHPFDSKKNAKRFVSTLNPDVVVMIRHDLWPNHIWEIRRQHIPLVLANCSMRSRVVYSLPVTRQACQSVYGAFTEILAVSPEAKEFCKSHFSLSRVDVVGDTRYDQVVRRAKEAESIVAPLRRLKKDRLGFVAGSTWPSDEDVILPVIKRLFDRGVKLWVVLVPHEPTPDHLSELEEKLKKLEIRSMRFSRISRKTKTDSDVLLVDRIGILASLYALGEACFVGGAFGPGVHNVLEPAALGKAVFYGPKCRNSYEAGQLEKRGVGLVVEDETSLYDKLFPLLNDSKEMLRIGKTAARLVAENVGATERIVQHIEKLLKRRG